MGALLQSEGAVPPPAVEGWTEDSAREQPYLTFVLGGETYAIGILAVKEIIEYGHLTPVPLVPRFIRGVINLRGAVVPVVDLAARFGREPAEVTKRTCIVIVEVDKPGERQDIGVVVDAVNEVLEIPSGDMRPAPSFGTRIRTDFVRGMGKVDGEFVVVLDADQVLSVEELATLEEADLAPRLAAETEELARA